MPEFRMPFGKYEGEAIEIMVFQPERLDYLRWIAQKKDFRAKGVQKKVFALLEAGESLPIEESCGCGNAAEHAIFWIDNDGCMLQSLHCHGCLPRTYGKEIAVPLKLSSTKYFHAQADVAKFLGLLKQWLGVEGRLSANQAHKIFFPPPREEEPTIKTGGGGGGQMCLF